MLSSAHRSKLIEGLAGVAAMGAKGGSSKKAGGGSDNDLSIGDRVKVSTGKEHMPEHTGVTGTVRIVQGQAIGIQFDGIPGVHKWYAPDELRKEQAAVEIEDDTGATDYARDALAVIQEYQGSMYSGPGDEKDPAVAKLRTARRDNLAAAFREAILGIVGSTETK